MLVKFMTKSHADIVLFGDIAQRLLKMMGHSGTVPSAIPAEEVPAALERLKNAVEAFTPVPAELPETIREDESKEPIVSLKHRALPLIELFAAAARNNNYVMWEKM
ncbi:MULTISPECIES: DUF1840 domain-containing protein [unclassified Methylobacter]|jgi:hypothetical protein|uniref:DUF1840 domain-containing protein n=1 Tax=unclassified Methylobacter TaxID=2635283 RepID=UPI001895A4DF|nr:DUF1840 domain-containing protein [Methylobacter sp. BlB1]MBF6649612.1 DUF1840 domain-containing protein [Methylobacter sp. BlB1]